MANRYAVATGNWSNTATWNGGTLPQAGDDVRANAFTVTIDQDITVATLRNDASSPAAGGGAFVITSATTRTLNCNLTTYASVTSVPPYTWGILLRLQSTGIVNIIGNMTNIGNLGGGTQAATLSIEANCTVNHTGNATGGSNVAGYALSCPAIRIISTCTFNGVGTYAGGSGYDNAGGNNAAIEVTSAAGVVTINITGNLNAGTAMLTPAVYIRNNNNSALNVTGIVQSSSSYPAILTQFGIASSGILTQIFVSGSIINVSGINAICTHNLKISSATNVTWLMQTENALVNKTLYSANALTGYPLVAKVETGTIYGPSNEFTGTLDPVTVNVTVDTNAIAAAISTSLETSLPPLLAPPLAPLLATDLLAEISTSTDPLAERLRNASTVQTTGAQLQSLVIAP